MKWARILGATAIAVFFTFALLSADRTPTPTCGDLNNSGDINLTDAIYLFEYIFGQHPPFPDPTVADVNCDGRTDISDVTYLLAFIYYDGAAPCAECPSGGNHAPIIHTFTASPTTLPSGGGTTIVTTVAEDQDGDLLTYVYNPSIGFILGSGSSVSWSLPANPGPNELVATLVVTVSDGKSSPTATLSVLVLSPGDPGASISGTLSMQAGSSGDLGYAQVAIYATLMDWNVYDPFKYTATIGSGTTVTYAIYSVPQGTYYLDAWKDNDSNLYWSSGDIVGWYGSGGLSSPSLTAFSLFAGENKVINVNNMIIIP